MSVSRTRVVVLTAHSMFTEGVATRLRQYLDQIDLFVVDSREPDCLTKVKEAEPAVVLLEANDENTERFCPLGEILEARPDVRVIRLDPDLDQIHVVTSEVRTVNKPTDLITMLVPPALNGAAGLE